MIALLSVRAHPIGWSPHRARVGFGRNSEDAVFHLHRRYVVVAHRQRGGRFVSDGVCGLTRELNRTQLRKLLRVVRSHGG